MAAVTGQKQFTATAATLGSQAVTTGLIVTASPQNTGPVAIGVSGVTFATGDMLWPGMVKEYSTDAFSNASACYGITESGKVAEVTWLAY